jgi:hypothetical protein
LNNVYSPEGIVRRSARVLLLTFLAPDIVEAILDGKQPRDIQLQPMARAIPADWNAQWNALS